MLREPFVQSQRKGDTVGEGVRNLKRIEERRHLRFAGKAEQALGVVEHHVPPIARGQTGGQALDVSDTGDGVSQRLQCCLDGVDRFGGIEFGRLFFGVPLAQVVVAEVVGESDSHRRAYR